MRSIAICTVVGAALGVILLFIFSEIDEHLADF